MSARHNIASQSELLPIISFTILHLKFEAQHRMSLHHFLLVVGCGWSTAGTFHGNSDNWRKRRQTTITERWWLQDNCNEENMPWCWDREADVALVLTRVFKPRCLGLETNVESLDFKGPFGCGTGCSGGYVFVMRSCERRIYVMIVVDPASTCRRMMEEAC